VQGKGPLIQYPFFFDQNNKNVPENLFKVLTVKIIVHGWNNEAKTVNEAGWVTDLKNAFYAAVILYFADQIFN